MQNESTHPYVFQIENLTSETNNKVHLGRFSHSMPWHNLNKYQKL